MAIADIEQGRAEALRFARSSAAGRLRDRAWRAMERAANLAPLSAKVKHKGGKVEVTPQPKKRGGK